MYRIEKRFTFPMGHRLSKHKGRCFSLHGHNFTVLVGVKAKHLDENDMVIDFSHLKKIVMNRLDELDHCLLLNVSDQEFADKFKEMGMRVMTVTHDPTAEKLAENLYWSLGEAFGKTFPTEGSVEIDYVTVFENENSKATYSLT